MSIISRIKARFSTPADLEAKAQFSREQFLDSSIRTLEGSGTHGAKPWPFNFHLAMDVAMQSWTYRCIIGNAEAAASTPLRLYVRNRSQGELKALGYSAKVFTGRQVSRSRKAWLRGESTSGGGPSDVVRRKIASFGDDFEEVEDHPVLDVLRRVNPQINGFDLATFRFVSLQATGNAYLHPIISQVVSRPVELWPLLPQWTWVVPGSVESGELIDGYVYGQTQNEQQRYELDEVLRFTTGIYPRNLFYAQGPTQAGWQVIGTVLSRQIMDKATYDNMARPDWLLVAEQMSHEQAERMKALVDAELRGPRNRGRWLSLGGGGGKVTAQSMQWAPHEMPVTDRYLEEIAGVYGYPITKLLANDPNRANAETGNAGWLADTVLPMLRRDEEALNQNGYLDLFGDGQLNEDACLAYDDPVPANQKMMLAESRTLVAMGGKTLNEDRRDRGLPEYSPEIGDVPRINGQSLKLLDEQAEAAAQAPAGGGFGGGIFGLGGSPTQAKEEPEPQSPVDLSAVTDALKALSEQVAQVKAAASKAPVKYENINFRPPEDAAEAAQQGLDYRDEYGRGGTDIGIARARDIANRENLSPETIGRMVSFFARHQENRNPDAVEPDGGPSNGWIAWLLWGGDAGQRWADKVAAQMDSADEGKASENSSYVKQVEELPTETKGGGTHSYSSTQVQIEGEAGQNLLSLQARIPNESLAEDGRENEPHVTVLYGIHTESPQAVAALLRDQPPIRMAFGAVEKFADDGERGYDVLYVGIQGDDLPALNAKLAGALAYTSTHGKYQPHATLAYVKPGSCDDLLGDARLGGQTFEVDCLTFSAPDGERTVLPFGGVKGDGDDAEDDTKAISQKALLWGLTDSPCTCHKAVDETGDAEDDIREDEPDSPAVKLQAALAVIFKQQLAAILSALGIEPGKAVSRRKATATEIERAIQQAAAELAKFQQAMAESVQGPLTEALAAGGAAGLQRINLEGAFDVANPKVAEFVRGYSIRLAGQLNQTSLQQLSNTLAQGMESGATIRDLSKQVQETFETFNDNRARTIARTESARGYVEGQEMAWEESGVVEGKEWLLAPNACEFCRAAAAEFNGKQVALGDAFYKQGTKLRGADGGVMKLDYSDVKGPPLHPNDRCDTVPVLRGGA